MTFLDAPVRVRVPATSANLGPGYDALGLALTLYDDVTACVASGGVQIDVTGEGESVARDESHLVMRAMRATFDRLGQHPAGLVLSCTNRIPHGRGLGSSAAAIVAGVAAARALTSEGAERLPDDDAFAHAAALEGHPDNVAACWYGGLTIAWTDGQTARAARTEVAHGIRPVVLIPEFASSTAAARGVLPATVAHADAAFTGARTALLTAVLSGSVPPDALFEATADRLHQPYRAASMPAAAELVATLRAAGLAAVVSGAGPTVLVLARSDVEVNQVRAAPPADWRCAELSVDRAGARVTL